MPSLNEINKDDITQISKKNWFTPTAVQFASKLVEQLYVAHVANGNEPHKVMILELSHYLENYLWPNFKNDSSKEHIISIVAMINEKFRETLSSMDFFHSDPKKIFFIH